MDMNVPVGVANAEPHDRTQFLGGSDAAAVMGLSPWATPVELWQKKTGRTQEVIDLARQRRFARGHKLEPIIVEMMVDKLVDMGLQVELLCVNQRYTDPEHPFLSCEIDAELLLTGTTMINGDLVTFNGEHVNADAKSVSGFARNKWGEEGTESVPIEYATQFMHGLMVTGRRYTVVAALRSFDDVDIFWTVRDDETIAAMRPKLVSFWVDHVLADVPPDPYTFTDIKLLYPLDNGEAIEATAEIAEAVDKLRAIKLQIKTLEEAEERLKVDIGEFIAPNARLTFGGRDIATYKGQSDTRLDLESFRTAHPDLAAQFTTTKNVRVLRLPKPKKG